MSCYGPLAQWYDQLTGDVDYERFADYYENIFSAHGGEHSMLLDLCCGTGSLTAIMTRRGHELIAVDSSIDMLMKAQSKCCGLEPAPLFLNQDAGELDLYGTVDAAYSSLDGINYLPPDILPELFHRLRLFIRPGGLFIFDMRSPEFLESLDGQVFVDEKEDVFCIWRAEKDSEENSVIYGMDLFSRSGRYWTRDSEEHVEYLHDRDELIGMLRNEGFEILRCDSDVPVIGEGRFFITAERR